MQTEINRRDTDLAFARPLRLCASVAFAFLMAALLWPISVKSHEPITTKVRFNKELIRIFQRSCLGCHRPGGIAMSLASYEEARPWAKAIKEEILEKRMPPWHAVKGYGEFANAPLMTQREIDLIVNWVEGGAPKGEDKDLPEGALYSEDWPLGKPDSILKSENPIEIRSDADEHRTITIQTNLKEDRWIAAIDLLPDNDSVVHCARLSLDGKQTLGTWMPGQRTIKLPDGVAQLLPAGARITLKIHYRASGEAAKDQSAVGLYFAKPPRRQAQEIAITNPDAVVPAGGELHRVTASFTAQEEMEAIAIRPLAHPLIVSLQATAYRPDGTEEVLIWARGYSQDWQQTYYLKRAAPMPRGTRVDVIAYFDNSEGNRNNPNDPPKQLRLAEVSPAPLCALLVSSARPASISSR